MVGRRKLIAILYLLLTSLGVFSQIDTEFWFAAPQITTQHAPDSIRLCFITFDEPANVVVAQPALSNPAEPDYFAPIHIYIPSNSYKVLYLNPYRIKGTIEVPPRGIRPFGIQIISDEPISAYYAQTYYNSEIYSLKGKNALGTDFLVPMQNKYGNSWAGYSSIQIVATEDDTEVEIETLVPTYNSSTPGRISITLDRGYAYAVRAANANGAGHLHNTKITSNKPIAVNSTDDSADTGGSQDLVGDQIVPLHLTGDEYIAIKNTGSVEQLYIFATEPNTDIYINKVLKQTINPGDVLTVDLTDKASLITSGDGKKIVIFQLTSSGGELGGTMLPRINCTGSREIVYRPAFIDINPASMPTVNLLVKTDYIGEFSVNGSKGRQLTAAHFTPVPAAPEWSYCSMPFTAANGVMRIKNDSAVFHAGILDSGDKTLSYGYFSDYNTTYLLPQATKPYYFSGETVRLSLSDGDAFEDIVWEKPDGSAIMQDELVFEASDATSGIYKVEAVHKGGCTIDYVSDVVVHVFNPQSDTLRVCKGDSIELAAKGYAPCFWIQGTDTLSNMPEIAVSPENTISYGIGSQQAGASLIDGTFKDIDPLDVQSDYTYTIDPLSAGYFTLVDNAQSANPAYSNIPDRNGNAKLMTVHCDDIPRKKIWTKEVKLERNTRYEFSAWFITAQKGGLQAALQFFINGQPAGDLIMPSNIVSANDNVGARSEEWERFACVWDSGSRSTAQISIETVAGIQAGATVCIDDIAFKPLFPITDTLRVEVDSIKQPIIKGTPLPNGETVLDAGVMGNNIPYPAYRWYTSNGDTIGDKKEISVNKAGEYFVEVTNGSCNAIASYVIEPVVKEELEVELTNETAVCEDDIYFTIDYTVIKGSAYAYSVFYEDYAQAAGFENKIEEPLPDGELNISLPLHIRPDVYRADLQFFNTIEDTQTPKLPLTITVKYAPERIFAQKWNDVLVLYNPEYNNGFRFTAYQWYRNGQALEGETGAYLYLASSEFDLNDTYSVLLTREDDGVVLSTCEFVPERREDKTPFPTLVDASQIISLKNVPTRATVIFTDMNGVLYSSRQIDDTVTDIQAPARQGMYVVTIINTEGARQYKMIVK